MRPARAALAAAAPIAAALALAGCGSDAIVRGGVTAGATLTVWSSLPEPGTGASADIVAGEKLALAEQGGRVDRFTVTFVSVGEAAPRPERRTARAAAVTRDAIKDTQAIAVIGGARTAETRTTAPLLNAAGFLHVAVGAGYPGFTRAAGPDEPARYQPSGRRTFARVTGDDLAQAEAIVAAAERPVPRTVAGPAPPARGGRTLAIETEGGEAARALASAVLEAAGAAGLRIVDDPARADAVLYAGEDPVAAAGVLEALAAEAPEATLLVPDALARAGVTAALPAGARRRVLLVTAAAPAPPGFAARFRRAFGRAPGPYAALGYVAMGRVLAALTAAGPRANHRQAVIDAFFAASAAPRLDATGVPLHPAFTLRRAPA